MRIVTLQRQVTGDEGTFGTLAAGALKLATAELPWRDLNGDGRDDAVRSCIRPGRYSVRFVHSPRFGRKLFRLDDAQTGRVGILIHVGNWAGDRDKGLKCNVEGCILLGLSRGIVSGQMGVLQSAVAVSRFHDEMGEGDFVLDVLPIAAGELP